MASRRATDWIELESVSTLLEVSRALSARLDLQDSIERALAAFARRQPLARRVVVTLHDDLGEVDLEAEFRAMEAPSAAGTPVSSPIVLGGITIGVLRADVAAPVRDDRAMKMLSTVAAIIADRVRVHRLIVSERRRLSEENVHLREALRSLQDSGLPSTSVAETSAEMMPAGDLSSFRASMDAFEKEALIAALKRARGNRAHAARLLSTTERIFNYRVRKHGIEWRKYKI
jgi:transcriptional regulator with GAF, ATPase, and Fis domain